MGFENPVIFSSLTLYRPVDWNLQIDSYEAIRDAPGSFKALLQEFRFLPGPDPSLPRTYLRHIPTGIQEVQSVEVKSLSTLPFGKTPYEIQVAVTQRWSKLPITGDPDEITWGVSVRAVHWDEALNATYDGAKRKDWSEGLHTIWPGEGDLGERLRDWVQCILVLQEAFDHIMKQSGDGETTTNG